MKNRWSTGWPAGCCSALANLKTGFLTLVEGNERFTFGDSEGPADLRATITVSDRRFYRSLVFGGSIGAGEAYMADYWRCDNLTALTRLIVLNERVLLEVDGGLALLAAPFANSITGETRTPGREAAATSRPITTSATTCTPCFSTRP